MDVIITVGLERYVDQEWRDVRYLYDYNEQELIIGTKGTNISTKS